MIGHCHGVSPITVPRPNRVGLLRAALAVTDPPVLLRLFVAGRVDCFSLLGMPVEPVRDPSVEVLIAPALETVRPANPGAPAWPGVEDQASLVQRFYRFAADSDVSGSLPDLVIGPVRSMTELAEHRSSATPNVRILNPTAAVDGWSCERTCVQIVTDDMPFLVDSLVSAINDTGHGIYRVLHPRIVAVRDRAGKLLDLPDVARARDSLNSDGIDEAWLYFEIDRETHSERLDELCRSLLRVLADVRVAVDDWQHMRVHTLAVADELALAAPVSVPFDECAEAAEFLRWLCNDHFTFLGYRDYDLTTDEHGEEALVSIPSTGLGLLRTERATSTAFARMPAAVRRKAREPRALVITKANRRSTVHRPAYLDYVGVKRFDEQGNVVGERRIIGLLATTAYATSVLTIPRLRQIAHEVFELSGFPLRSHNGKDLLQFLETYPRDELFQVTADQLWPVASKVLALQERRQTSVFLRADDYGRFVSALVYLPRDKYDTTMRERLGDLLKRAYGGDRLDFRALLSDSVLARLHYVIRTPPGVPLPVVDEAALTAQVQDAARTWLDRLQALAIDQLGEDAALDLLSDLSGNLPRAYQTQVDPAVALADLQQLAAMVDGESIIFRLERQPDDGQYRFALYRLGASIKLAQLLPIFDSLGVEVQAEHPFAMGTRGGHEAWIYHVDLRLPERERSRECDGGDDDGSGDLEDRFAQAFAAAWSRACEVDRLNQLVLLAGLRWHEVGWVRAWVQYARQLGLPYSPEYVASALIDNPAIACGLVRLFYLRLDPAEQDQGEDSLSLQDRELLTAIDAVASLGQDRTLRQLRGIVLATLRTNAFSIRGLEATQAMAIKLDTAIIPAAPKPIPKFETWVCSPRVAGVHLRFGRIARGGLRWSDRPEDFRTEILGLAKAQEAKNAVIIPVGAKGGFVVKAPAPPGDREAVAEQGRRCYREFVSALLSITDNLVGDSLVPPPNTVRRDGDDPYLVVAADKGTATFSDLANEVAHEYGYWLGDAFASGGSAGYDHKAMGITARGAFEAVKRHFRELGVDVMREPIVAVGIGDMAGDVFGNAMLISPTIRLVAAFDHRHIFIDPDPDPAMALAERRRLASLPRSSWADYALDSISRGGGVYPRSAKSLQLSDIARQVLGIESTGALSTDEVVRAILMAPVDLLFNGGIGTFVKACTETDFDVGDKANDAVRINGMQLRVQVVGEGGNLGLTQYGRIEAAINGVALNTDAIDNSAGVDCSDHEVNIKIALDAAVATGAVSGSERDPLLAAMTDDVAELVLRDNYLQNVVLGNARAQARILFRVHWRMIQTFEANGILDRAQLCLPDDAECERRAAAGRGLTSPELSVLLAVVKISLTDQLRRSDLAAESFFTRTLADYFPTPLVERLGERISAHPLRAEIIATQTANEIANFAGTSFVFRAAEETGAEAVAIARAYTVIREIFELPDIWTRINALDGEVPAAVQTDLHLAVRRLLDRATRWLLTVRGRRIDVMDEIEKLRDDVTGPRADVVGLLSGADEQQVAVIAGRLEQEGAPAELARVAAAALDHFCLLDIGDIARRYRLGSRLVAEIYFELSAHFGIGEWLERVSQLPRGDQWENMARAALRSDTYSALAGLTIKALRASDSPVAGERIRAWVERNEEGHARAEATLAAIQRLGEFDLPTLVVALRMLRTLVAQDPASEGAR